MRSAAQDGRRACLLLYLAAVRGNACQQERCQVHLDIGLSAWELAYHVLPTTVFAAQSLYALSLSARYRPSQTVRSGMQRARSVWSDPPPVRHEPICWLRSLTLGLRYESFTLGIWDLGDAVNLGLVLNRSLNQRSAAQS